MPTLDPHALDLDHSTQPALKLVSVVLDADQPLCLRDIRVGNPGDVVVVDLNTGSDITFLNCFAGERLGPFRVAKVKATGTTASSLVGYV